MNKPRSYSEFGKTSLSAPWSPSREGTSGGTKHPKGTCALFPEEVLGGSKGLFVSLYPSIAMDVMFSAHHS